MSTVQAALPGQPIPLSPDEFPGSGGVGATTPETPSATFTESDRVTLRTARDLLTSARAKLVSRDAQVKNAARKQIEAVTNYLIGFCDGKDLIDAATVQPGFEMIFGTDAPPDLDAALAELDAILEQILATADTRFWRELAHAVGDACIAVGAALVVA